MPESIDRFLDLIDDADERRELSIELLRHFSLEELREISQYGDPAKFMYALWYEA